MSAYFPSVTLYFTRLHNLCLLPLPRPKISRRLRCIELVCHLSVLVHWCTVYPSLTYDSMCLQISSDVSLHLSTSLLRRFIPVRICLLRLSPPVHRSVCCVLVHLHTDLSVASQYTDLLSIASQSTCPQIFYCVLVHLSTGLLSMTAYPSGPQLFCLLRRIPPVHTSSMTSYSACPLVL